MAPGVASKVVAACCGLTAFAVGIVSGLAAGNPAETVLTRALIALVVGNVVGLVIGAIGERTIAEAIAKNYGESAISRPSTGLSDAPARKSST